MDPIVICVIKVGLSREEIEKIILGINSPTGWYGYSVRKKDAVSFVFEENGCHPYQTATVSIKDGEIWAPNQVLLVVMEALIGQGVDKYFVEVKKFDSPIKARKAFEAK